MLQQSRIESGHLEKNKLPFKENLATKNLQKQKTKTKTKFSLI
jgi:hypothetical protein